jgi:hypothetical protein
LVQGADSFVDGAFVLVLEKCVPLVHAGLGVVFYKVKGLQLAKGLAKLSHFILLHVEGNTSHENPAVFIHRLATCASLVHVLKVLFFNFLTETLSGGVPPS